ncbi:MAG: hypothetical protein AB7O47_12815 [Flavobacteriales bacterium]
MIRNLLFIILIVALSLSVKAQEFSSIVKIEDNRFKVEVVFEEIIDVNVANSIIKELKTLPNVLDVELFYPSTTNGYIFFDKLIDTELVVAKLREIGVQLNSKSFKN